MTVEFLERVITTGEGYFCLATLGDRWNEIWFRWPEQKEEIIEAAEKFKDSKSVYFTAHLFSEKHSTREAVLPSRTVAADLDYAAVPTDYPPTILLETSPNRHQAYWILREEPSSVEQLEKMSRGITYHIPNCDRGCWQLGHKMRMPGTYNFKYPTRPAIKIVKSSLSTVKSLPVATGAQIRRESRNENWTPVELTIGPKTLLAQIKGQIPGQVYRQYDRVANNRSDALYGLMMACFRAGFDRDQVFYLAKHSANNKFADNRYNADLDLKKDVLRAEEDAAKGSAGSIRDQLDGMRKANSPVAVKRRGMAELVRLDMSRKGKLISTADNEYFVRSDTGVPITLGRHSPWLDSYLEEHYYLNRTEQEQHYIVSFLESVVKERSERGETAYLSYYKQDSNTVLLHTGQRDVLEIGKSRINVIANGEYGIVFPFARNKQAFELVDNTVPFESVLNGCFDNVIDLTEAEARAIIHAWFMFVFFRDAGIARPILALFGQPGAGKSTLFRRIYTLLYGRNKSVNSLTTPEDFDHAVSQEPLVVFDNVDTYSSWLPDKLALAASTSDLDKRRLYTDTDTVTVKRQALIGITAHNPKFRREDIVDRLLLLNFKRLEHFIPEADILDKVWTNRDAIWTSIAKDIQAVLREPYPEEKDVPKFRISDFARAGLWIARALGFEDAFRSALEKNIKEQQQFNLEEESMLVDALKMWLTRDKSRQNRWVSVGKLHSDLSLTAPDEFGKIYPRSLTLGRKLYSLQDTLRSVLNVEFRIAGNSREWRFAFYGKEE